MSQLYIYPLFFRFYSHVGHYRVLSRVPYAIQFPGGVVVMNPPANAGDSGDTGLIPGSERSPGGRKFTPVFLPGKFHGQ